MRDEAQDQGGWVLLEVLAALTLMALALAGLSEALSAARRAAEAGGGRMQAVLAAESLLERLAAAPLEEGVRTGILPDGRGWRADILRHPANPEGVTDLPVLMRITVVVGPVRLETMRIVDVR